MSASASPVPAGAVDAVAAGAVVVAAVVDVGRLKVLVAGQGDMQPQASARQQAVIANIILARGNDMHVGRATMRAPPWE
jgi:hypothetical protein